jgi:hypothetical protein
VPRVKSGLERGGISCEGLGPSSEVGTHPRGRQTLERGGSFMGQRLPLERDGGSPEGCRVWLFDGPLRLFWVVGFSLPWVVATRGVFYSFAGFDHSRFIIFRKGSFPRY